MEDMVQNIIEKYGHGASYYGVRALLNVHRSRKGDIVQLLRRHPNYEEERQAIILRAGWTRPADADAVKGFIQLLRYNYSTPDTDSNYTILWQACTSAIDLTEDGSALTTELIAETMKIIAPNVKGGQA